MKFILPVLLIFAYTGCKSVETMVYTDENNQVIMKSTETALFSDPKEKLKFIFTPDEGGQINSIYWEGEIVGNEFSESYPDENLDIKKLKPRILDDGSGLIIVDSTVRGKFQLRRSYNLQYDKKNDEHIVEVIYNVKNYSSDKAIDQRWIQQLSLPDSLNLTVSKNVLEGSDRQKEFRIEAIDVKDLLLTKENGTVQIGNTKSFKLGFKERLSWKVLYILKAD